MNFFMLRNDLPSNALQERGAVLRLSVWNKNIFNDGFIGECFISLRNLRSLKNVAFCDVPVSEKHLRRPHKNNQPEAFKVKFH